MISEVLKREVIACLNILNSGGIILYPTDTIWGIGCDATRPEAVSRIYRIKKRIGSKSQIVLLDSPKKLPIYVEHIPLITWDHNLLGEDGSIAIRIPDHEFCRELVKEFGKPIVSTSANLSGKDSPHAFSDINPAIIRQVDYTVGINHDTLTPSRASRMIKIYDNGEFNVIRP